MVRFAVLSLHVDFSHCFYAPRGKAERNRRKAKGLVEPSRGKSTRSPNARAAQSLASASGSNAVASPTIVTVPVESCVQISHIAFRRVEPLGSSCHSRTTPQASQVSPIQRGRTSLRLIEPDGHGHHHSDRQSTKRNPKRTALVEAAPETLRHQLGQERHRQNAHRDDAREAHLLCFLDVEVAIAKAIASRRSRKPLAQILRARAALSSAPSCTAGGERAHLVGLVRDGAERLHDLPHLARVRHPLALFFDHFAGALDGRPGVPGFNSLG